MKTKGFKYAVLDTTDKGIVTIAIAGIGNKDAGGDVIHKGAFTKTFNEGGNRVKHLIDHQMRYGSVVGVPIKMYETETQAVVESALNLEKQSSRDLFSDYKFFKEHGKTLEHSFGYQTIKGKENDSKGEDIFELKMFEYSTVFRGMNENTPLLGLKDFNIDQLQEYLSKFDVSDKKAKHIEKIIALAKKLQEPEATPAKDKSPFALDLGLKDSAGSIYNLNLK